MDGFDEGVECERFGYVGDGIGREKGDWGVVGVIGCEDVDVWVFRV